MNTRHGGCQARGRRDRRGTQMNTRHGGPYDRGMADKWYGREFDPHYYVGATYNSDRVEGEDMTLQEMLEYTTGYEDQQEQKYCA